MTNSEREALEEIASALDKSLGDSDITHLTDDEIRYAVPAQWACSQLNKLLQATAPEELLPVKLLQAIKYELQRQAFGAPVDKPRVASLIERINEALPSPQVTKEKKT